MSTERRPVQYYGRGPRPAPLGRPSPAKWGADLQILAVLVAFFLYFVRPLWYTIRVEYAWPAQAPPDFARARSSLSFVCSPAVGPVGFSIPLLLHGGPGVARRGDVSLSYADKILTCRECGQAFTFSAGEQEFYAQRGLQNEPGRCPDCRAQARSRRESRPSSRGGYESYGQPRREMHTVTCANCGRPAQVPFVPRGDRPVYCSDCFNQMRSR